MNETDHQMPDVPAPKLRPSPWTPRAVWLIGVLGSIVSLGFVAFFVSSLTNTHGTPSKLDYWATVIVSGIFALGGLVGTVGCFVRASEGFRVGRVRPLSYPEQWLAAGYVTLFAAVGILSAIQKRQWAEILIFLLNPMMFTVWGGVVTKRGQVQTHRRQRLPEAR